MTTSSNQTICALQLLPKQVAARSGAQASTVPSKTEAGWGPSRFKGIRPAALWTQESPYFSGASVSSAGVSALLDEPTSTPPPHTHTLPPGCRVGLVSWLDCDLRKLALLGMGGAVRAHVLETALK